MGFIKDAAKVGLFGLTGLAATGAFKGHSKEKPQSTLLTQGQTPSLVNKPTVY